MTWVAYVIPALFLALFSYALFKKIKLYDCFTEGVKEAVPLILSIFPYLAAIARLANTCSGGGL